MAEITAALVKELRDRTDAPMMECKKALVESGGELVRAEEILRVKLGSKAAKAASRIAAEGVVGIHVSPDRKLAAIVELNCETDFVARNPEFSAFAKSLAELVAARRPDGVEALAALPLAQGSVEDMRKAMVGRMGENLSIRRFSCIEARGQIGHYVHGGSKIGVLVDIVGGDETLAKDIAMHIAASKPIALTSEQVSADVIERERSIAARKAAESGKPANIVEKMIEGSVRKFIEEATLLGQPFVRDDKLSVGQLLKARGASVAAFTLYVVGQGIERKTTDFAAEVAAVAGAGRS
ncbi:MAG: translation elongation factor Ts [Rhodocyclaceae bacterium]